MSTDTSKMGLKTQAVHAGEGHRDGSLSSAPDLVMSSTFRVEREVSFSANNIDADAPYVYTRWANPTTDQLEEKLAVLEKAEDCIAFASGMGATTGLLLGLLNVIPYLGSIIGLGICLPLAYFQEGGGLFTLGAVIVVFTLVQLIESYLLTPKIMGDRTGLHPMAIIVAIFFWGSALDGILGMILAIPHGLLE